MGSVYLLPIFSSFCFGTHSLSRCLISRHRSYYHLGSRLGLNHSPPLHATSILFPATPSTCVSLSVLLPTAIGPSAFILSTRAAEPPQEFPSVLPQWLPPNPASSFRTNICLLPRIFVHLFRGGPFFLPWRSRAGLKMSFQAACVATFVLLNSIQNGSTSMKISELFDSLFLRHSTTRSTSETFSSNTSCRPSRAMRGVRDSRRS